MKPQRLISYSHTNNPTDEQIGYILTVANEVSAKRYEQAEKDIQTLCSIEEAESYIKSLEKELADSGLLQLEPKSPWDYKVDLAVLEDYNDLRELIDVRKLNKQAA